jgi:hypothetical protein
VQVHALHQLVSLLNTLGVHSSGDESVHAYRRTKHALATLGKVPHSEIETRVNTCHLMETSYRRRLPKKEMLWHVKGCCLQMP